jgi:hypothetical protein
MTQLTRYDAFIRLWTTKEPTAGKFVRPAPAHVLGRLDRILQDADWTRRNPSCTSRGPCPQESRAPPSSPLYGAVPRHCDTSISRRITEPDEAPRREGSLYAAEQPAGEREHYLLVLHTLSPNVLLDNRSNVGPCQLTRRSRRSDGERAVGRFLGPGGREVASAGYGCGPSMNGRRRDECPTRS